MNRLKSDDDLIKNYDSIVSTNKTKYPPILSKTNTTFKHIKASNDSPNKILNLI